MFKANEDLSLHVTRGDNVTFSITATKDNEAYSFNAGDVVRIKVTEKKDCNKVILQKDFAIETNSESVTISLTEKETRIGDTISKPVDYWYEIELNPFDNPQTIIGYDEDGPKVFRLYPEGRDLEDIEIEEEDVPFVDKALDMTSTHPVENQAIARKFATMEGTISKVSDDVGDFNNIIDQTKATLANHTANHDNPHGVTKSQVGLGNVDNTSDMNKPVSTAQADAIYDAKKAGTDAQTLANNAQTLANNAQTSADNAKTAADNAQTDVDTHIADKNNPHGVTTAQIGAQAQHQSKVITLLVSNWLNKQQTVSLAGLDKDDTVFSTPNASSRDLYVECNVRLVEQGDGTLTYVCEEIPASNLTINVTYFPVGRAGSSGGGSDVAVPSAEGVSF